MATPPDFSTGQVLTAAQMNAVGLWLVKTQTVGTTVSSVQVTGAFSADYQNYRITYTGGTSSVSLGGLGLRLGSSTTGYRNGTTYAIYATGGNANIVNNAVTGNWTFCGSADSLAGCNMCIDVLNPFDSTRYTMFGGALMVRDVAGATGGVHENNVSYTAFTIIPNAGTISGGIIRVYGYRN